jgi:hypothetical protein
MKCCEYDQSHLSVDANADKHASLLQDINLEYGPLFKFKQLLKNDVSCVFQN